MRTVKHLESSFGERNKPVALGKLERDEVIKHILEAERLLRSGGDDGTGYRNSLGDIYHVFDNILNALKRIAGAME